MVLNVLCVTDYTYQQGNIYISPHPTSKYICLSTMFVPDKASNFQHHANELGTQMNLFSSPTHL